MKDGVLRVGTLEDMMSDMKAGVFDMTQNGECTNCGGCCSDYLPVSNEEITQIKKYIKANGIKEQKHFIPTAVPTTFDMTCPFRNNTERVCVIYAVRPAICRDFKCDNASKGIKPAKELYENPRPIRSMRQTFFSNGDNA